MENKIGFCALKEGAKIPSKEKYNAGYDIYPCFEEEYILIESGQTKLVPTGIASVIPEGYYMQIQERGSSGSKGIKYSAGVIDSSYRGEWFLATTNTNTKPLLITKTNFDTLPPTIAKLINENFVIYPYTKALFQAIVHNVHNELEAVEITKQELEGNVSERGEGKLGSSGK
ncbi:MAG: dUTP pyrophosphatase [Firmicutes bacterium]|nr:dUTP pyrophosphatase [Bacillota bacterium]